MTLSEAQLRLCLICNVGSNTHRKVAVTIKGAATNKAFKTGLSLDSRFGVKVITAISRVGWVGSAQTAGGPSQRAGSCWESKDASCPSRPSLPGSHRLPHTLTLTCTHTHLDLRLGHPQGVRQPGPLRASQVLGLLKGLLQGKDLVPREGGPSVFFLVDAVTQGVRGWQEEGQVQLAG